MLLRTPGPSFVFPHHFLSSKREQCSSIRTKISNKKEFLKAEHFFIVSLFSGHFGGSPATGVLCSIDAAAHFRRVGPLQEAYGEPQTRFTAQAAAHSALECDS